MERRRLVYSSLDNKRQDNDSEIKIKKRTKKKKSN